MAGATVEQLKAIRKRVLEEIDWGQHEAAQVLSRLILSRRYVPGTPLPLDEELVRLVLCYRWRSPMSPDNLLKIRQRARELARELPFAVQDTVVLTGETVAQIFRKFKLSEMLPFKTAEEVAEHFIANNGWGELRPGQQFRFSSDWLEAFLTAWKVSTPSPDEQPPIVFGAMARWLQDHGYPAEPVPLTIDRVAMILDSWFVALFRPNPPDILSKATKARDRLPAYRDMGRWEEALLLIQEILRDEAEQAWLFQQKVFCQLRLGRFQEALDSLEQWRRQAAKEGPIPPSRQFEARIWEVEALLGMNRISEACDKLDDLLVNIESIKVLGDLHYLLNDVGVTMPGIENLSRVQSEYAAITEMILKAAEAVGNVESAARLQATLSKALGLGERVLRVFPGGHLDSHFRREHPLRPDSDISEKEAALPEATS